MRPLTDFSAKMKYDTSSLFSGDASFALKGGIQGKFLLTPLTAEGIVILTPAIMRIPGVDFVFRMLGIPPLQDSMPGLYARVKPVKGVWSPSNT